MRKLTGVEVLGIVTIAEIIFMHSMGSLFLWVGYGFYKLLTYDD